MDNYYNFILKKLINNDIQLKKVSFFYKRKTFFWYNTIRLFWLPPTEPVYASSKLQNTTLLCNIFISNQ